MAVDVYLASDIRNMLQGALVVALETTRANGAANLDHLAGVLTLGKGIALQFGLPWAAVMSTLRGSVGADMRALLDQVSCAALPSAEVSAWHRLPYLTER